MRNWKSIYPLNYNNTDIKIWIENEAITVISPKDTILINILKDKGYWWNPHKKTWYKPIKFYIGDVNDRIAEITNAFLLKGFCIRLDVENFELVKEKALAANFEPEIDRWVGIDKEKENLLIVWRRRLEKNKNIYKEAKQLKEARWIKNAGFKVPISHYEAVVDFANLKNFSFTDEAKKAMREYEDKMRNVIFEKVAPQKESLQEEKLIEILDSSAEVLSDLKDD